MHLETLYKQHGPGLLAFLQRRFGRGQAAEDLLQETFLQALRRMDRLGRAVSPRAWLFGIARHLALTAVRRRRVFSPLPDSLAAPEPVDDARLDRMRQAIARLPDGQREPLELRLRDELTYDEIAEVLEIPVGTVRSRLHYSVRRLRDELVEADQSAGRTMTRES